MRPAGFSGGGMARRLGCLSIPDFQMRIFLLEHPEWKDEAVVLLDRDEANGRILALNGKAADLGLVPGLMFGPCLGIHRNLKAGVADEGRLFDWKARVEEILFRFSPSVEAAAFQDGLWWLDGKGLGKIFPSVRPWLEGIRNALVSLGLEGRLSAGSGRFSTWAAAWGSEDGEIRIFPDERTEQSWFQKAPLSFFSLKADTRMLLQRLKILDVGELLKIPPSEIRRRLDKETAGMVELLLQDSRLPLQPQIAPEPVEWHFPLEEPTDAAGYLCYAANRLIGRCAERARQEGRQVRSMRFVFEGQKETRELVIRPASPTRNETRLAGLFASRLDYLDLSEAVRGIRAQGYFCGAVTPQAVLFGSASCLNREAAHKALSFIQAERGAEAVQFARLRESPLPTRQFELRNWAGFPRRKRAGSDGCGRSPKGPQASAESSSPIRSTPLGHWQGRIGCRSDVAGFNADANAPLSLVRRVSLEPGPLVSGVGILSRAAYSGGWWNRLYDYELAWGESRGRTCWLKGESGRSGWTLIGWLE